MKEGDIVFVTFPRRRKDFLIEYKVISVGEKYFKAKRDGAFPNCKTITFNLATRKPTDHSVHAWVYLSMDEYHDFKEHEDLNNQLARTFRWDSEINLSLDQLRRIKNIVDEVN